MPIRTIWPNLERGGERIVAAGSSRPRSAAPVQRKPLMFQLTLWSLLPLVCAALAVRTHLLIRARPRVPGTQALQALTVLVIFWCGCLLVETSVTDLRQRTAAVQLGYLSELLMPVTWFALAFCYVQRQMHLTLLTLNALCLVPVISTGLAMTNGWHGLEWR